MLDALIRWSLQSRLVVLSGSALLIAGGYWTALELPVDVFPDLSAPRVTVLAEASGMAPEEIEALVTLPIETALNGATHVRRVRSSTNQGIAVVWVEFDWGTDTFMARQIVSERLRVVATDFPPGLPPPILAPTSSIMGEIMMIGLTGPQSPRELRTVADWTIRQRLLTIPGVSQVVPIGGEVKELQVLPDPDRMLQSGVSLREVVAAAEGANANAAGGVFSERGQEYVIRGIGRTQSAEEVAETVVALRGDAPVRLADVASVVIGSAPRRGDGSVNAYPGVVISVQKQPAANTLELTRRIEAQLAEIQRSLPDGMKIHTDLFRQERFIRLAIDNLLSALRDGAVLVVLILMFFLLDWRATAISALAIPLSLVVAVFALQALGGTINTMTLGGMAIATGALVDDAIIDVENVFRRLRENHKLAIGERRPSLRVVFDASREIRSSILNATLVIVVVFLPLFFLSGVEGRLLRPLGFAYVVSLLASLLVAVSATPALCSYLLPGARAVREERESAVIVRLKAWYAPALEWVLASPRVAVAAAVAAFIVTLASLPFLGTSFLPEFNEGALTVSVGTVPGTSLSESSAIGLRAEQIALSHPSVMSVDRRQGRAELDEHAMGVNVGELDVTLAEGIDKKRTLEELRRAFASIPGTNVTIGQPISHRIDHMLSGTRAAIAIKIFGPDLYRLRVVGGQVQSVAQSIPGLVDVRLEQQVEVPQLQIRGDRRRLAHYGLSVGDLAQTIDIAFGGRAVSRILEDGRSHDLVVRFPEKARGRRAAIASTWIDTPAGTKVPLSQVAEIQVLRGPNTISRENVARKIVVQANIAGRDLGSAVRELQERITSDVDLPAGYHVEYGGQFESQEQASRTIGLLSLLSVALIFLILFGEFGSTRVALLVMVNLPLSLIGGVAAVMLTDRVLSVASLVGFVALFGIATRNGVLLLSHYRRLQSQGVPLRDAIVQGSLERLAPILMTALTAGLALVPLALRGGEPGSEIQSPMAVVILGGLLSATALNMVVLPALYWLMGGCPARSRATL